MIDVRQFFAGGDRVEEALERLLLTIGRQESLRVRGARIERLSDAEFRIFSQWGEDGILQYLISRVPVERRLFVEFGVQDYSESNTRFLLCNDSWSGLVMDSGKAHVRFVARQSLDWKYGLVALSAFVTRENVNELIAASGIRGDIGLLSIDVDGNDYWLLEAIDVVSPRILVVEYNATFGTRRRVTIPYRPDFQRTRAHSSNLYWGASLSALTALAGRKGYLLVGCNSAGNNAFFVRRDVAGGLRELSVAEAHVESRFCESRDAKGRLTFLRSCKERLAAIADCRLIDLDSGELRRVSDLFGSEDPLA